MMAKMKKPLPIDNEIKHTVGPTEEILDDSEYSTKTEFSKATIIQQQIMKCLELRSKDMKPGYTTWVLDKDGSAKPQIVADSRKEYVSSVEALKNTLAPELDVKRPELEGSYEEEKKKIFDKYAYREKTGKIQKGYDAVWVYSGRVFMPQKGTPLPCDTSKPHRTDITYNTHSWDAKIDAYWDELLLVADELYAELNRLIHILDYFQGESSW